MSKPKVDAAIAGTRFSPCEFAWDWTSSQLIARAGGCSLDDERDRPLMLRDSTRPGHPMLLFNGALLARNRAEVMDVLVGGYDNWQEVGRWGSASLAFHRRLARRGRARVASGIGEVGATSKGHALVRFVFEIDDVGSGERLADGWMLLFALGCGSPSLGRLALPRTEMPKRPPDLVVRHETPVNVTFDWAMPSDDWNTTHFETRHGNPAPLVHGPRNMTMVINDVARAFAEGDPSRVAAITLGSIPAPHFPREPTETRLWREGNDRFLGRLAVPAGSRTDGGTAEKIVIDQIELKLRPKA